MITISSLSTIGEIYRLKGNFELAQNYYTEALSEALNLGNNHYIALCYNNLGIVKCSQGELKEAFEYFENSIDLAVQNNTRFILVESAYYKIKILVSWNRKEKAQETIDLLNSLVTDKHSTMYYFYKILSEAYTLRHTNRFTNIAKAQKILEEIIQDNTVYNEISIHAMLNLCELFLIELKAFREQQTLEDLERILDLLEQTADSQISQSLLAEVYLLKGRFALILPDIDAAQEYFSKGLIIAKNQEFTNLARIISDEHDRLLKEINKWSSNREDFTIKERIERSKIDLQVNDMINRLSFETIEEKKDVPVMLLILADSGVPLYSSRFNNEGKIQDALLSGFLSVINDFIREVFSVKGLIKRIEHNEYLIIFRQIDNIIFSYIYKGTSFTAESKLDRFIAKVISNNLWDELVKVNKTGIVSSKGLNSNLNKLLEETF